MAQKIYFKEIQKFTQWWLWLIMLAPISLTLIKAGSNIYEQLTSDSVFLVFAVKMPMAAWLGVLTYILTILFVRFSKLVVNVTDKEIRIRHLIFFKKVLLLKEIEQLSLVKYNFLGYGIKTSKKYGTVYNVKGNQGVLIRLKHGRKYLLGTQKPTELLNIVSKKRT